MEVIPVCTVLVDGGVTTTIVIFGLPMVAARGRVGIRTAKVSIAISKIQKQWLKDLHHFEKDKSVYYY